MVEDYEIDEVIGILRSHRPASDLQIEKLKDGYVLVSFNLMVRRPPRGFANGVQDREPIRLLLEPSYPMSAPYIMLRPNFSQALPHINPSWDRFPDHINPCIVDEHLDVFMRNFGFAHVVQRLQKWLDDAAYNILTRDDQYWEPIRRDGLQWFITADRSKLLRITKNRPGRAFLPVIVNRTASAGEEFELFGVVQSYQERNAIISARYVAGNSANRAIGILLWPGNTITDHYLPDDVATLDELNRRSRDYGCPGARSALAEFSSALAKLGHDRSVFVFIILVARRPNPLPAVNADEYPTLELIPYLGRLTPTTVPGPSKFVPAYNPPDFVFPFGLRQDVSARLLRATSGETINSEANRVALVGCGSLGSKIAMHLGKAGFGKIDLYDKGRLEPHNLARMGVMNDSHMSGIPKTRAVKTELLMLGHTNVASNFEDVVPRLVGEEGLQLGEDAETLVDATASPNVHDALCRGQIFPSDVSVWQTSFMADGRIGFLAHEGTHRRPDLEDIKAAFWRYWVFASESKHSVWPDSVSASRLRVGEGCESVTMIMSDVQASLLASGIANQISKSLGVPIRPAGWFAYGVLGEDGCTVTWIRRQVNESTSVETESTWQIRILDDLVQEIEQASRDAGNNETGGFLMGRVNWAMRRITLAVQIAAPPDSVRSQNRFVLGVTGAREALLEIHHKSRRAFCAIGTWHSHPRGGRESATDRETLSNIAATFYGSPAVSLIWSPEGYRGIVEQDWPGNRA